MIVDTPVVVVGAGLAGLVVAHGLTAAGIPCRVLESTPRAGGRIRTTTFEDGVRAEAHMEEFWESSPAYPLLRELGLDLDEDAAHSGVILDQRLHPARGGGGRDELLTDLFSPREQQAFLRWNDHAQQLLARIETEGPRVATSAWARPLRRTSFASYVTAHVGRGRVAEWIRVVVESETAVEWHQIGTLDGVTEMRHFLDTPRGFGERNAHVVGGNDRLVDALVARLPAGTLHTGRRVGTVRAEGDHVQVHHGRGADSEVTTCEHVVLTAPVWSLRSVHLALPLSPGARSALAATAYGSYVKVLLRLRPEAAAAWAGYGDGLFALLTDSPAGCVYLTDPGDGRDLVLTLLVHGVHARRLRGLPAEEIVRRVTGDLDGLRAATGADPVPRPLWPGLSRHVTDARAHDYPQAVAYWPVRLGRSRFDDRSAALREPQGRVHFGGDTTEGSHSDGAVRSAQRIARTVAETVGGGRSLVVGGPRP